MGDILRDLVATTPAAAALSAARRAWPEAVGGSMAAHSTVERLVGGVLEVRCDHPAVRLALESSPGLATALGVDGVDEVRIL